MQIHVLTRDIRKKILCDLDGFGLSECMKRNVQNLLGHTGADLLTICRRNRDAELLMTGNEFDLQVLQRLH